MDIQSYYETPALAEKLLDKVASFPCVGITHTLEVKSDNLRDVLYYVCLLCSRKFNQEDLINHVTTIYHLQNYLDKEFPELTSQSNFCIRNYEDSIPISVQNNILDFSKKKEHEMGRGQMAVCKVSSRLRAFKLIQEYKPQEIIDRLKNPKKYPRQDKKTIQENVVTKPLINTDVLYMSKSSKNISNYQIEILFSRFGSPQVKNFNSDVVEIRFKLIKDARQAYNKFNGLQFSGKPIQLFDSPFSLLDNKEEKMNDSEQRNMLPNDEGSAKDSLKREANDDETIQMDIEGRAKRIKKDDEPMLYKLTLGGFPSTISQKYLHSFLNEICSNICSVNEGDIRLERLPTMDFSIKLIAYISFLKITDAEQVYFLLKEAKIQDKPLTVEWTNKDNLTEIEFSKESLNWAYVSLKGTLNIQERVILRELQMYCEIKDYFKISEDESVIALKNYESVLELLHKTMILNVGKQKIRLEKILYNVQLVEYPNFVTAAMIYQLLRVEIPYLEIRPTQQEMNIQLTNKIAAEILIDKFNKFQFTKGIPLSFKYNRYSRLFYNVDLKKIKENASFYSVYEALQKYGTISHLVYNEHRHMAKISFLSEEPIFKILTDFRNRFQSDVFINSIAELSPESCVNINKCRFVSLVENLDMKKTSKTAWELLNKNRKIKEIILIKYEKSQSALCFYETKQDTIDSRREINELNMDLKCSLHPIVSVRKSSILIKYKSSDFDVRHLLSKLENIKGIEQLMTDSWESKIEILFSGQNTANDVIKQLKHDMTDDLTFEIFDTSLDTIISVQEMLSETEKEQIDAASKAQLMKYMKYPDEHPQYKEQFDNFKKKYYSESIGRPDYDSFRKAWKLHFNEKLIELQEAEDERKIRMKYISIDEDLSFPWIYPM